MALTHTISAEQLAALRMTPLGAMPNRARLARTMLNLEQGDAADGAGLKRAALSAMERGDYKALPFGNVQALADYYGVLPDDLFPARDAASIGTRASDRAGHDSGRAQRLA